MNARGFGFVQKSEQDNLETVEASICYNACVNTEYEKLNKAPNSRKSQLYKRRSADIRHYSINNGGVFIPKKESY